MADSAYCYCSPETRAVCSDPNCPDRVSSAAQGRRWWQFWRRSERIDPFTATAPQRLSWPSAVMLCVRQPVEHHAILLPYEDYPAEYPNIFGPPRHGPRCSDCGALLYVAAARVRA